MCATERRCADCIVEKGRFQFHRSKSRVLVGGSGVVVCGTTKQGISPLPPSRTGANDGSRRRRVGEYSLAYHSLTVSESAPSRRSGHDAHPSSHRRPYGNDATNLVWAIRASRDLAGAWWSHGVYDAGTWNREDRRLTAPEEARRRPSEAVV